jgi:hypothetical protein
LAALDPQASGWYTAPCSDRPPVSSISISISGVQTRGAKEKKRKNDVPTYLLFLRFFEIFRSDFRKYFYGVFGLLMQRNSQKRDKKNRWGKTTGKKFFSPQLFRPKAFDMDFPQKVFFGVFELPLLRNAQKRHKRKLTKK